MDPLPGHHEHSDIHGVYMPTHLTNVLKPAICHDRRNTASSHLSRVSNSHHQRCPLMSPWNHLSMQIGIIFYIVGYSVIYAMAYQEYSDAVSNHRALHQALKELSCFQVREVWSYY